MAAADEKSPPPWVIYRKQLGDVLLLEPALARLAHEAPGGTATLATRAAFAPLVSLMAHVTPARFFPPRRAGPLLSLDPKPKAALIALAARPTARRLVVTRPKWLKPWHRWVYPDGCAAIDESTRYRAQYLFDIIPGTTSMTFRPPRLLDPPEAWLPPDLPRDYFLLHPTSAWQRKCWPAPAWGEVLAQLHRQGVGPFVLTGGPDPWEVAYAAAVAQAAAIPLVNLCGKTPLPAYLAIVARAKGVLCVDGSATHLAAAFQRPSLTLFGPTNPLHWHGPDPRNRMLHAAHFLATPEPRPAVERIPRQAVLSAALELAEAA